MNPYLQDPDVTIYHGDVLETLRELPSESVHMCCTSPPFYGLRDYGTGTWEGGYEGCDHMAPPGKSGGQRADRTFTLGEVYKDTCGKCGARRVDQQIGLEPTPDEWVARLVEVFRDVRRVLRRDATFWLELGDSFGAKQLRGTPWKLAFALQDDGWLLRSEIIWSRPNPMPESVTDRPTTSHSRVFLLTKSARYFYDAEAIREPHEEPWRSNGKVERMGSGAAVAAGANQGFGLQGEKAREYNPAGRNRRSVWTVATQPYPEAHFATWPEKLVEPMILAGTSERGVCPECGAPWERVTDVERGGPSTVAERIEAGSRLHPAVPPARQAAAIPVGCRPPPSQRPVGSPPAITTGPSSAVTEKPCTPFHPPCLTRSAVAAPQPMWPAGWAAAASSSNSTRGTASSPLNASNSKAG